MLLADFRHHPETGTLRPAKVEALIARLHGSHGGRAHVVGASHAPDTRSRGLLRRSADLAREAKLLTTKHLSQSQLENAEIQRRDACSPTRLPGRCGLLDGRMIAAHCSHMSAGDVARFGAARATVAHVPKGNVTRGAIGDTPALCAAAARIRVGSVGEGWQPEDAFAMVAVNGAAALGKSGRLGTAPK